MSPRWLGLDHLPFRWDPLSGSMLMGNLKPCLATLPSPFNLPPVWEGTPNFRPPSPNKWWKGKETQTPAKSKGGSMTIISYGGSSTLDRPVFPKSLLVD